MRSYIVIMCAILYYHYVYFRWFSTVFSTANLAGVWGKDLADFDVFDRLADGRACRGCGVRWRQ